VTATATAPDQEYGALRARLDAALAAGDDGAAVDALVREQELRAAAAIAGGDPGTIATVAGDLSRLARRAGGHPALETACRMLQYAALTASHARELRTAPPQTTAERIVTLVARSSAPLSNQEIADELGIDKAYVSRVIQRLIDAGQLRPATPRRRQYDHRRKYVTATPAARRALRVA
jgi:DNA-binding MarR family transcriptional regulator